MKRLTITAISCVMLLLSGCWTANGVFAPRSGEIFQTTRMGPGPIGVFPILIFGGSLIEANRSWTRGSGVVKSVLSFPLLLLVPPIMLADECVVSPAVDLVCLPYDLLQPNHGFVIRIVDDDGRPVAGAKIDGSVSRKNGEWFLYAGDAIHETTNEKGEVFVSRLYDRKVSCLMVEKEGFQNRTVSFEPVALSQDADGRLVATCTLVRVNAPKGEDR